MTETDRAIPRPAATVVLLRPASTPGQAEVLLTRRPPTMAFAADLDVFPGGRVDPADGDPRFAAMSGRSADEAAAILGDNVPPADALALHAAAIRELLEEVGVVLTQDPVEPSRALAARERLLAGTPLVEAFEDGGSPVRFAADRLVPVAQWTTPTFMPRRFATWFFAADLPSDAILTVESDEVVATRWVRPHDALDGLAAGASTMWVPTSSVLQQLAAIGASAAADVAAAIRFGRVEPAGIEAETEHVARIATGSTGAVPGRFGTTTLLGRRDVLVLDPGDPSEDAIDTIVGAVDEREGRISAIVLSDPDPDHAAGAEALAIPLRVPILAAPGAGRHLPYDVVEVRDGEDLPSDLRVQVRLGPPGSGRLEIGVRWSVPDPGSAG